MKIIQPTNEEIQNYGLSSRAENLLTKEISEKFKPKTLEQHSFANFDHENRDSAGWENATITREVDFMADEENYFTPLPSAKLVMDKRNMKHLALIKFYVGHSMIKRQIEDRINPLEGEKIEYNHHQAYKSMCAWHKVDPNEMEGAWQMLYLVLKSRGIGSFYTREDFFNVNANEIDGFDRKVKH